MQREDWEGVRRTGELIVDQPPTCSSETTVADAAKLMWEGDCGILPVVDTGEFVDVVTDRDMYIALPTRNTRASGLRVGEVATGTVVTCEPEDDMHTILSPMRQARIRRIPVMGFGRTVLGIVSMNDVLMAAGLGKPVDSEEVLETLQAICGHSHAASRVVAA